MSEPGVLVIPLRTTLRVQRPGGDDADVRGLVHIATRFRMEWRSLCGDDFMSYETTQEADRVPTCVWCLAGVVRRHCFDFFNVVLPGIR